ncbi:TetR/AcrR family transcriptional regulator [Paenibacillus humicus]|uniref:TetR/AcrR family transcriptional regulator n=1 Tax=Paenibacillus humicus TaxID=412861 RepID=UPI000FD7E0A6|nr:TetR/AcrR family transcriptional regulator [Paenibacillus humicus]
MPRNQRKDQLLREERRQQILEAAARIFARRGMLTKISDIAAGAKLSQGHVYNYFKSKDEILLAVIEQGQLGYGVVLRETISMPGIAEDKFRCLAERSLPSGGSPDMYLVLLQALFTDLLPAQDKAVILERADGNLQLLVELIREGQEDGSVMPGDPVQLATLLGTLIQNLMLLDMRGYAPATKETIELLLKMIRPAADAAAENLEK